MDCRFLEGFDPEHVPGSGWIWPTPRNGRGKPYDPAQSPALEAFHNSTARFRALVAGRGAGKSAAGAQESQKYIGWGCNGAVFNPDFENFKTSTWPEFRNWVPWDQVIPSQQYRQDPSWEPNRPFNLSFLNGVQVRCKGLRDPEQARGPNITWLWYDEAGRDKTGYGWTLAVAAVRIVGPGGVQPAAWATATPSGKRHWMYNLFVKHDIPDEVQELLDELGHQGPLYDRFHLTIHDNRANLDPLFYASMLTAYTGKFAEQELQGLFVEIAEGLVYEQFGADNITTRAEFCPTRGPVEIAYDDGFAANPRVFLLIQRGEDGEIYLFDELYRHGQLGSETIDDAQHVLNGYVDRAGRYDAVRWIKGGAGIEAIKERLRHFEIAVGDPSAAELKGAFRRADIPARGGKADVVEGIKRVRSYVRGGDGVCRLLVHPRCKQFIQEMSEDYRYPEGSEHKSDIKPLKEADHGPDAIRYYVMTRTRSRG